MDQRIAIELNIEQGCPPVLADPSQLESALLNLAINARDAMADGGRLTFDCRPVEPPEALAAELHEERYVAITVADSGCGMPESVKRRAFEPFFTTKEGGRGTGLGLATVYGFARQSRGGITLDSTEGEGTTFRLYLPMARSEAPRSDEAPSASMLAAGLRVLLVEDDAEVRAVVNRFLQSLGCEVTSRTSAEHALPLLHENDPPDLLLTDIALGSGMRGTELAQRARERHPDLPVLLMTGFSSGVVKTPPGYQLLHKPYTRDELARAIGKVLGGST
jgi:CheY-like chemotaxis protein